MPEFVEEETGRRLYHENETTLEIEKAIAKKFVPKKGDVTSSYMHRDMDEEEPFDVDRAADCSKAKQILNWSPKVSIDKGLEKTYEWCLRELG